MCVRKDIYVAHTVAYVVPLKSWDSGRVGYYFCWTLGVVEAIAISPKFIKIYLKSGLTFLEGCQAYVVQ